MDEKLVQGLERWFSEFNYWLLNSPNGLAEKNQGNNHSSWWGAQVAAYSLFIGDSQGAKTIWQFYREFLVPHQMQENGGFPEEEKRTRSLFYSVFNLEAWSYICRLASIRKEDLWNFQSTSSAGIVKGIQYVSPYLLNPESWKGEQIDSFSISGPVYPAFVGLSLGDEFYFNFYKECRLKYGNDFKSGEMDPFILLLDMVVALMIE